MSAKDHAWQRAGAFLRGGMWDVDLRSLRFVPRLALGAVRIVSLVFKGFWEDDCPIFASALTFNTLMALVPILILSLAFARGLGNVDLAKDRIRSMVSEWTRGYEQTLVPAAPAASGTADAGEAVSLGREIDRIVERAFDRFDRVNFGALGGVGFVFLLWMVIILLFVLELSFNRVWGLTRGRARTRRRTV
jgi:membrane protein